MIFYSITDFSSCTPDDFFYLTHKNTTYAVFFKYLCNYFNRNVRIVRYRLLCHFLHALWDLWAFLQKIFRTYKSAIYKIGIFLKVSELHLIFLYFRWKQKLLRGIARSVSIKYDFQRNNFITYTRKNNNNDLKTSWICFLER